jgi:hypothetical protein
LRHAARCVERHLVLKRTNNVRLIALGVAALIVLVAVVFIFRTFSAI